MKWLLRGLNFRVQYKQDRNGTLKVSGLLFLGPIFEMYELVSIKSLWLKKAFVEVFVEYIVLNNVM